MPKRFKPSGGYRVEVDPDTGASYHSGHHHEHRSGGGRKNNKDESGHQQRVRRAQQVNGIGRRTMPDFLQSVPFGHQNRLLRRSKELRKNPKNHKSTIKAEEYRKDQ